MNAWRRRKDLMEYLYVHRMATVSDLARRFGVSTRTIRRDVELLSLTEPIYTVSGRYRGGIYLMKDAQPEKVSLTKADCRTLENLLCRAEMDQSILSDGEVAVLRTVLLGNDQMA